MKTILGTLVALGLMTGVSHAKFFDEFRDPRLPLPHSVGAGVSDNSHRQALPRSDDKYRQALPLVEPSVDIVTATP